MNHSADASAQNSGGRPFLGIHMKCCNMYVRAYLNQQGTAYLGHCPKCATPVRVDVVAEGGSSGNFFTAD